MATLSAYTERQILNKVYMDESNLITNVGLKGIRIDPKTQNLYEGLWTDIESLIFDKMLNPQHPFKPFGSIRLNQR